MRNLCLLLFSVLLVSLMGEGLARSMDIPRLFPHSSFSRTIGRELPVNAEQQYPCNDDCIRQGHNTVVRFNGIGIRDIDHDQKKPEGVKRIVVLGDSMTSGEEVPLEQTMFRQLQKLLDRYSSEQWEVISLGVRGASTLEEIVMLEEYGLRYDPDIVVLQTCIANDIFNNSIKALGVCESTPFRPYAVKKMDGTLQRTTGQSFRNTLRHHSALFVAIETVFLKMKHQIGGPLPPSMLVDCFSLDQIPPEHQPLFTREGWEITELLLTQLSELLRKNGTPLVAYDVPLERTIMYPAGDRWQAYASGLSIPLLREYGPERLRSLFEKTGDPFLPLLPILDAKQDAVLPYWNHHLNPDGQHIVAEAVLHILEKQGFVQIK